MNDSDEIGVFLGLDVGKTAHHGHGLTPAGKKVFDKQLPSTEPKLRDVFEKVTGWTTGCGSPKSGARPLPRAGRRHDVRATKSSLAVQ